MEFTYCGDRRYAQFERLRREAGVVHVFSTRPADVAVRCADPHGGRAVRRRQMALDIGLRPESLRYCEQVHGARMAIVDESRPAGQLTGCDAAVTDKAGMALMVFSADCPLVLLYDPVRRVLALVHASWRCIVAGLTRRVVEAMSQRFGSAPQDLLAGLGPGAGPCCYEVQQDVFDAAADLPERERLFERRGGRLYFDLWEANRVQLCAAGVAAERIEVSGICTLCRNDLFYSFRREGDGCGRFGLMAGLA